MHLYDVSEYNQIMLDLEADGQLFSGYRLSQINDAPVILGKGASALVYEMYEINEPGKRYALKVTGLIDSSPFQEDKETEVIRQLSNASEHIVKIIDVKTVKTGNMKLQLTLMEKVEDIVVHNKFGAVSLVSDRLEDESNVVDFALQIGEAIKTAHDQKVLHRDIKLENIFWDKSAGIYKLGDFGIAKYSPDQNAATIVGTDGYKAPEIANRSVTSYSTAADIYSFGIVLYLLLNDLRFPASDGYKVNYRQYVESDFVVPAPAHASLKMTRIVRKMCSFRPDNRYSSIDELLMDLRGSEDDESFVSQSIYGDTSFGATEALTAEISSHDRKGDGNSDESFRQTAGEIPFRRASERPRKSRERLRADRTEFYIVSGVISAISAAVFLVLFTEGISLSMGVNLDFSYFVISIVMAADAVVSLYERIKPAALVSVAAICIGCILKTGISVVYLPVILLVFTGDTALLAGGAGGVFIWMLLAYRISPANVESMRNKDIWWIFLILLLLLMIFRYEVNVYCFRVSEIMRKISKMEIITAIIALLAAGLVVAIAYQTTELIPEAIRRMHLLRCAVVSGAIYMVVEKIKYFANVKGVVDVE